MTAARAEDRDYSRLRAEWLRLKNQVYDANAELPTLAAVLDDVRRLIEDRGTIGVLYLDLAGDVQGEASHGWMAYDEILRGFARAVAGLRREDGLVAPRDTIAVISVRSDKFLLFLGGAGPGALDDESLAQLASRVRDRLAEAVPRELSGRGLGPLAFHDGHALLQRDPMLRPERAIHRALDQAMLMSLHRRSKDEDRRAHDLDGLIRSGNIESLYQPIMDLRDLTVLGHEVFSRGPKGSTFEDAEGLFALAERTGRLLEFERLCRGRALTSVRRHLTQGGRLFLNTSAQALLDPDLAADAFAQQVESVGLEPKEVVLEITERVAVEEQGGGEYDRFRSRIMFPIRDRRGRTLGFGGRAMRDDQGAKYVNTAETDFFHKSQLLYGVDRAKAAIAKAARAVVVEGYTDVLALHQAGVEETVAVMGTAITGEQVAALSGMVEEVVLALDADSAGQEAMLRAQRVASGRKMRLRVAAMPAGEDPAEMMAEPGGSERFRALVDAAVEVNAFQVGLVLARTDAASPLERDRALDEVAPILATMGESASRDDLVRQVAERLDLEPAMVMGRVVSAQPLSGGPEQAPARPRAGTGPGAAGPPRRAAELTSRERRERALLAMCIALPAEGKEYLARLTDSHLSPTGLRAATWLRDHPSDPASDLPREDDELAALIAELVILANDEPASHESMELNFLLLEQRRLEGEIAAAGEREEDERRAALSRERASLVERIARTQRVES